MDELIEKMKPIEAWTREMESQTGRIPRSKILGKITDLGLTPESVHNSYHKTVFVFKDVVVKFCNALEISREKTLMKMSRGLYVDVMYIGTNMIVQRRGEPIAKWTSGALSVRIAGTTRGLTDLHLDNIMKFGEEYRIIDGKTTRRRPASATVQEKVETEAQLTPAER